MQNHTSNHSTFEKATAEVATRIPDIIPSDLDLVIGYFRAYIIGALIVYGIIGNILSALVFYRRRNNEDGWTWYLFWLAIADTGCLLSTGLPEWASLGLYFATNGQTYFPLLTLSDVSCRLLR
jgi:hypothetical protein